MGAGRAAFDRQAYEQAGKYFRDVINDTNTPSQFLAESYFAYGDTFFNDFLSDPDKPKTLFDEAIKTFSKITKDFSTNALASLAWGRMGECYFQWNNLNKDSAALDLATNAFSEVLKSPLAEIASRSQAEVGLGKICEAKGKLDEALEHYARILYIGETDEFDPTWTREAGYAAGKLCESRSQWIQAIKVYERMLAVLPSLKAPLEKKILLIRTQMGTPKT